MASSHAFDTLVPFSHAFMICYLSVFACCMRAGARSRPPVGRAGSAARWLPSRLWSRGGDWACTFADLRHNSNGIFNLIVFIVIYLNVQCCPSTPSVRPSVSTPQASASGRTVGKFGIWTGAIASAQTTLKTGRGDVPLSCAFHSPFCRFSHAFIRFMPVYS